MLPHIDAAVGASANAAHCCGGERRRLHGKGIQCRPGPTADKVGGGEGAVGGLPQQIGVQLRGGNPWRQVNDALADEPDHCEVRRVLARLEEEWRVGREDASGDMPVRSVEDARRELEARSRSGHLPHDVGPWVVRKRAEHLAKGLFTRLVAFDARHDCREWREGVHCGEAPLLLQSRPHSRVPIVGGRAGSLARAL